MTECYKTQYFSQWCNALRWFYGMKANYEYFKQTQNVNDIRIFHTGLKISNLAFTSTNLSGAVAALHYL